MKFLPVFALKAALAGRYPFNVHLRSDNTFMHVIPQKFWRPASDSAAERISCPPYDSVVLPQTEARSLPTGMPLAFYTLIPNLEIGFAQGHGTMEHSSQYVYDCRELPALQPPDGIREWAGDTRL